MTPYYEHAGITIYHGDCRDVLPSLGKFDLLLTDPPYGETSLEWDRWVKGWPSVVAVSVSVNGSMWVFGSMRMFLENSQEFKDWDFVQDVIWEKHNGTVRFNEQWIEQPLQWKKPRRIFVVAHGDLFQENVPDEWIDKVFAVMGTARQHTFQVLTKRPGRMQRYMKSIDDNNGGRLLGGRSAMVEGTAQRLWSDRTGENPSMWMAVQLPLPNVWLGTSVEDQKTADERIPHLMETPAAVRWLSVEPLLGEVDLGKLRTAYYGPSDKPNRIGYEVYPLDGLMAIPDCDWDVPKIDWVVVGGESGPGARYMELEWARSIRDQCQSAGVPFFMKQVSRKGIIPEDLLIREYPRGAH